jgi:hypothetical protein
MTGRPGWPLRTFQVQNKRKPARCQATTVSGLTMASAERQSRQRWDRQIHKRHHVQFRGRARSERQLSVAADDCAEYELVQINLKLRLTDAVVRANQPLLHVANGAVRPGRQGGPWRRSLLRGWVRATCLTSAAFKFSNPSGRRCRPLTLE